MAKGSQLSQLKSALSQAGLSRQSQPGDKKRKRTSGGDTSLDKEKKAKKLDEIQKKLNPFDVKVTKLKHDVGGRKVKGVTGRPGLSKQVGIEQRKRTLLVEYDQRSRVGGVVDRRFGENDPHMTAEERMLERFTKEKQRNSRSATFNLDDEDELTHYGQSLNAMDDFDSTGLGLEDDEEERRGQIDRETVQKEHFGGFDEDEDDNGEPARKKSKAEVMTEVIAKSKEHKYLRQLEKEKDENIRHQLDQEFNSIRSLLLGSSVDPKSTGSNAVPLGVRSAAAPEAEEDDYDQFVREIAFEKRAKPTDRTKTEEELAMEEKEKLEKAEKARMKRMRGDDDDEEDEEGETRKSRRRAGGDDLEDDFYGEQDEGFLGRGLGDQEERLDEEGGGSEDEGQSDLEDEDPEDGHDDSEQGEGDLSDTEPLTSTAKSATSKLKGKGKGKGKELPFTFPCPATHDEFLEILEDVDTSDIPTVVQRIRVIYHPSLAEDNKVKLQVFCNVLIDHVLYTASQPEPSFTLISFLAPHIFALSKSYPIPSANAFVQKLTLMQKNLTKGLSRGAHLLDSKTFPGTAEFALLRIIGKIWPTSDFSHPVVAPAMLLMGQYLAQARVRTVADLASGLFLCSILHQYEELSQRLVPEAINFLLNTLIHLFPHKFTADTLPGAFPCPDFASEQCRSLKIKSKAGKSLKPTTPDLSSILLGKVDNEDQVKVDLLSVTLALAENFAKLYGSSDAFIELFEPTLEVLEGVKIADFSETLKKSHLNLRESLSRMIKFAKQSRRPLTLQAHKPIPIPSVIPHFNTAYSGRKDFSKTSRDDDKEGAKLRAQYKQERKGAIRELRKDNKFLASEQAKRQEEKDRSYNERMKKVEGSIQVERHEEKMMEREKKREKKRR